MSTFQEEQRVRRMRDRVFETPSTDQNWHGCKEAWLKPVEIAWLEKQVTEMDVKVTFASNRRGR